MIGVASASGDPLKYIWIFVSLPLLRITKPMRQLTIIAFILFVVCHFEVVSQPCFPDGIQFFSQGQIDNFPIDYPNCSEIEGYVVIGHFYGMNIANLDSLYNLVHIGGNLIIQYNYDLTSIAGLSNLNSIGGLLDLFENDLSSLYGLNNLTSIGGGLYIMGNDFLESLSGLDNIAASSMENLRINGNSSLSSCEVKSVCEYLLSPNGGVVIYDNSPGCNSSEEVLDSCDANAVSVEERFSTLRMSVHPNPFTTSTTIEYELTEPSHIQLTIYNAIGETIYKAENRLMPQGMHTLTWTPERLPEGMYYAVLRSEEGVSVVKMVKQ